MHFYNIPNTHYKCYTIELNWFYRKQHVKVLFKWNLKEYVTNYFYVIDNISSYLQPTLNINLLKKDF